MSINGQEKSNFNETLANISRHFDENVGMRHKVNEINPAYRMPQWDD